MPHKDPVKHRACCEKWKKAHPEVVKAIRKKYQKKANANVKKWKAAHPEKDREARQRYRKENREKLRLANKEYRKTHAAQRRKYWLTYRHPPWTLQQKEKNRESQRKYYKICGKKAVQELKPAYVAKVLGISVKQCPRRLIEVKRAILTAHRKHQKLKEEAC